MRASEIDKHISTGLQFLMRRDNYLLEIDVSERSITHKLAEYYQFLFNEWNVDAEYNKNLRSTKTIKIDVPEILTKMADYIESKEGVNMELLKNEDLNRDDLIQIIHQLRKPNLEYDDELDIIYHLLELRSGQIIKKQIAPDIIVHHRGTRDNLVVVEAKKSSNYNIQSRAYDIIKLSTLVDDPQYKYKRGYFINFPIAKKLEQFRGFKINKTFNNKVYKLV